MPPICVSDTTCRTPDALQIAASIVGRCDAFLTNDITLQRVAEVKVITLDSLI